MIMECHWKVFVKFSDTIGGIFVIIFLLAERKEL